MDCKTFRNNHLAFVDGALTEPRRAEMQRHVLRCAACSRHDTVVRRGLLVARNLPPVAPSADFSAKLEAKLRQLRDSGELGPIVPRAAHGPGLRAFAALAASVVAVGFLASVAREWVQPEAELRLPPVVASQPETPPSPIASPAVVTAASTGMSVWSAVLVADEMPRRVAQTQMRLASLEQ